jgi:3-hexulose-6-phosphate synthase/6-phospho-3-hexuloisomerase
MEGIRPVMTGLKMVGAAVTVRTFPGDWSKPVQAIDQAGPGDVIVVDAGSRGPAVWGELATHSALQRKVAGIVIDGGIRDTAEIRALGFPAFARLILSNAGEPKGFGEINIPVTVGGLRVEPGDWIVGDDDGVMVLPKARAVEMANYGMDRLEAENRIRQEIEGGRTTLGQVSDLLRWDKVRG